jgi:hypothetical protein
MGHTLDNFQAIRDLRDAAHNQPHFLLCCKLSIPTRTEKENCHPSSRLEEWPKGSSGDNSPMNLRPNLLQDPHLGALK